jgi:hypothetical protein
MRSRVLCCGVMLGVLGMLLSGYASAVTFKHKARAQQEYQLLGRSMVEIRFGMRGEDDNGDDFWRTGVKNSSGTDNFIFSIGVGRWVQENLAVTAMMSVLEAETVHHVGDFGVTNESIGVVSLYMGMRYYFHDSHPAVPVYPYFSVAMGPVIGGSDLNDVDGRILNESTTLAAFGAYFGGGLDIAFSRRLMLGMNAGYNAMTDFSRPVGHRSNYSGPEFGISLGILF